MPMRRFEQFGKNGSVGSNPRYYCFQEAVAAFRGLFGLVGIIRIEIAHEDFKRV